jgi:hypothetical protein
MDIRQYIFNATRTYHYRLRTIVPVTDEVLSQIETAILRYEPLDMTAPKKTMFQASPLDFVGVKNAEVYIIDFETAFPGVRELMEKEIATAIGTIPQYVVVRTQNDPTELETLRLNMEAELAEKAGKEDLKPASLMATAETYPEMPEIDASNYYGDGYNKKFLNYVNAVSAEQAEARKVDATNPLFKWVDMPKSDVEAVCPPVPEGTEGKCDANGPGQSSYGNFDGTKPKLRRVYKSMAGKEQVVDASCTKGK